MFSRAQKAPVDRHSYTNAGIRAFQSSLPENCLNYPNTREHAASVVHMLYILPHAAASVLFACVFVSALFFELNLNLNRI